MTAQSMESVTAVTVKTQVSKNWWVLLIQGIATVLLGILLFMRPGNTLIAIAWVLGIFWLVGGVVDIIGAFTGKDGNRHWFWPLLGGLLSVVAGAILVFHPIFGAVAVPWIMTLFIGVGALLGGIFDIIGAIMMRNEIEGEVWQIVWGVVLVILGLWMLFNMMAATLAWVIVMAILMIIGGLITIYGSFRLRSLGSH